MPNTTASRRMKDRINNTHASLLLSQSEEGRSARMKAIAEALSTGMAKQNPIINQ